MSWDDVAATDAGPSDAIDVEPKEEELITWLSSK